MANGAGPSLNKGSLVARNINIDFQLYPLCADDIEIAEHLFVSCHFSQTVWQVIALWCNILSVFAFRISDILEMQNYIPTSKKKKVLNVVFITVFRSIWKMRNESLFSQKAPSIAKVVEEVKTLGFLRIRNRSRTLTMTWDD
ncbi:hypothetical protein HanOQP8_Chr15g0561131 [Helianthus annuus]|uniref:Reverse transcriptase zinc-binding domain-containing protein n=1 Tax=Helianthus annuus TaxID=4232 RepID=A0A251S5V2_HELAN|nr:uncharacterized protein LOC110910685 [Helianthus annuus]KAJ0471979.1 hypothetical protein HanHA89_Chr15g0601961 [Helianthus annuus]KAJ0651452.1 hypothetical protein HanOQP8_Chr15g0561131 [Helianthus annuus]KAJ0830042.1 hypothetical protein HanPSC8_Chr15g0650681 [Helianthus annuus]